jgi:DNA-directed RNA polymerase specialized sigma24 family protein
MSSASDLTTSLDFLARLRDYLLVAIRHAAWDFRERSKCPGGQGTGDSAVAALLNEAADSAMVVKLEQEISEAINAQIAEAVDAVKAKLRSPTVWPSFELHVLKGHSAREVAAELGIPQARVYVNVNRVWEMLEHKRR